MSRCCRQEVVRVTFSCPTCCSSSEEGLTVIFAFRSCNDKTIVMIQQNNEKEVKVGTVFVRQVLQERKCYSLWTVCITELITSHQEACHDSSFKELGSQSQVVY